MKPLRIEFQELAKRDLRALLAYHAEFSAATARNLSQSVRETADGLSVFPHAGSHAMNGTGPWPECAVARSSGFRGMCCSTVEGDAVRIGRILHGMRALSTLLGEAYV